MKLITDRLIIRNATVDDAPFFYDLMNSESWIKHIGNRNIDELKDAVNYIESSLIESKRTHGFALDVVTLKGEPIGICGLVKRDYLAFPDLGFALHPKYTGNGYIQEAGKAVITFAFNQLQLPKVFAITSLENQRSQSTLENLGFEKLQPIENPSGEKVLLFEKQKK